MDADWGKGALQKIRSGVENILRILSDLFLVGVYQRSQTLFARVFGFGFGP